ncbi:MAG: hypothetical protein IJG39_08430 [Synergistaceae bacterium]|nr:hypothetical protein [Synergistaceae bacterium]
MGQNELTATIERIRELEAEQEAISAEMETLKDRLKCELVKHGVDKMMVGGYKVSNTRYTTHRFDSKAFKADHAEMYAEYTKAVEAHRFTIA